MIVTYTFKNSFGIWVTVRVVIDGTEPAILDDYSMVIHTSHSEFRDFEKAHESGKSYREIVEGLPKISEVVIE